MATNIGETIKKFDARQLRSDLPDFEVGDTVKMKVKVEEAEKVRFHPFEGTVIRKTGRGLAATFTVRKISFGEGIERVFPIHSPSVDSIKVLHKAIKVRRAKLYYLRYKKGKKAKIKQH